MKIYTLLGDYCLADNDWKEATTAIGSCFIEARLADERTVISSFCIFFTLQWYITLLTTKVLFVPVFILGYCDGISNY